MKWNGWGTTVSLTVPHRVINIGPLFQYCSCEFSSRKNKNSRSLHFFSLQQLDHLRTGILHDWYSAIISAPFWQVLMTRAQQYPLPFLRWAWIWPLLRAITSNAHFVQRIRHTFVATHWTWEISMLCHSLLVELKLGWDNSRSSLHIVLVVSPLLSLFTSALPL